MGGKYSGLGSGAGSLSEVLSKMPLGKFPNISECQSPQPENGADGASCPLSLSRECQCERADASTVGHSEAERGTRRAAGRKTPGATRSNGSLL